MNSGNYEKLSLENGETLLFAPATDTPFKCDISEDISLKVNEISFGDISESLCIPEKVRIHEHELEPSAWTVDTSSLLPYGKETQISRKYKIFKNSARVFTDFETDSSMECECISLDNLEIFGSWIKVHLVSFDLSEGKSSEKTFDLQNPEEIYESEIPFLCMVIENDNGEKFELGTDDNLWRWINNDRKNFSSYYGILFENKVAEDAKSSRKKIRIVRKVLIKENETEIPSKNHRFSWYFNWSRGNTDNELISNNMDGTESVFDLRNFKLEKKSEKPCLHNHALMSKLKKWVRSESAKFADSAKDHKLILKMDCPDICSEKKHLRRGKMDSAIHWDMGVLLNFRVWANRQCQKNNCSFYIQNSSDSGII